MTRHSNVLKKDGTGRKKPKIFVLDTNVILHDYKAIRKFQDNDLVIPIAVIEELDKFKKTNDALGYNARGFLRELDKISDGRVFSGAGVAIGSNHGTIRVEPNHPFPDEQKSLFIDDTQDHRILSTAIWVRDNNPGNFVALVTKDINLRMKSKAVGMEVQDYLSDRVEEEKIENSRKEVRTVPGLEAADIRKLCGGPDNEMDWRAISEKKPLPNRLYRVMNGNDTLAARYDDTKEKIVLVTKKTVYGISPRNIEQKFAIDACLNPDIRLVSLTGGAGTGKTLIALAAALEQEQDYDRIIISRPAVVLGNQGIGYLPGDESRKMSPFLLPLMDNLSVIKAQFRAGSKEVSRIERLQEEGKLVISPLAYIRGRSLGKVFFIVDEAQNLTPHEIKTVITRAGEETKMVFTGDIFQIDQPYLDEWSNGLTHLGQKMDGQRLFEHVFLRKGERSELSEMASRLL